MKKEEKSINTIVQFLKHKCTRRMNLVLCLLAYEYVENEKRRTKIREFSNDWRKSSKRKRP